MEAEYRRRDAMPPRIACLALLTASGIGLAGCATPAEQAQDRESLLAAAGFTQLPANTPQRQAELSRLPPNRIMRTIHGDRVAYVYGDPLVCNCLYVGTQANWQNYQNELLQLRIANEQEMAAQMNENAAMSWDWGPWGPGWAFGPGW
jgi:hypothetical protein